MSVAMLVEAAQTFAQLSDAPARRCPEITVVYGIPHEWSAEAAEDFPEEILPPVIFET